MRVHVSKQYAVWISILLLISVLAGCSNLSENNGNSKSSSKPLDAAIKPKKEFANKQLNVAAFEGGQGKEYWVAVKQKFEADYPGVKINLTTSPKIMEILKPQIVAGNPPDFIYMPPNESTGIINQMLKDRRLLDLTDVFEGNALESDVPLKNKLIDGVLDYSKKLGDGKIYYAPAYMSPLGLIYNKALFDKKGWKVPETWDEFMALGEVAKGEGRSLFTYQGSGAGYNEAIFWSTAASIGGIDAVTQAMNYERGAFKSHAITKAMDIFYTIAQKGYLMPGTVAMNHTQAQSAFLLGKALFIPCGTWIENEMKDAPREEGFQFGFMAPPVFYNGDQQYAKIELYDFYIPAKAKNIELAKEFLRYQYKDEIVRLNAEKSKGVIAVKNGVEMAKPYIDSVFYDAMKIFDHGVKPLMLQWKLTPNTSVSIDEALWISIGNVMNKTMTVSQWQDRVEIVSGQLRNLTSKADGS